MAALPAPVKTVVVQYHEELQKTVELVLKELVNEFGPISAERLLGVARKLAPSRRDSPLAADVVKEIQKNYQLFLVASSVDPDDEVSHGITYRSLSYLNTVGTVRFGQAPDHTNVRMDLSHHVSA